MDSNNVQKEIMGLLSRNEEVVSDFYKILAEKFPEKKQFFNALAQEELIHANWIQNLHGKIKEGLLELNLERFSLTVISDSIKSVEARQEKFRDQELSLSEALSASLDIETTLAEASFFEINVSDSEDLKGLLKALKSAFIEHRDRIKAELDINS